MFFVNHSGADDAEASMQAINQDVTNTVDGKRLSPALNYPVVLRRTALKACKERRNAQKRYFRATSMVSFPELYALLPSVVL
jgi:hypothetical protein